MRRLGLSAAFLCAFLCCSALADTLYLKDGRKLDGRAVMETEDRVVFDTIDSKGATSRATYPKSEIDRLSRGPLATPKPSPVLPAARPATSPAGNVANPAAISAQPTPAAVSTPPSRPAVRPAGAPRVLSAELRAEVASLGKVFLENYPKQKIGYDLNSMRVAIILALAGDFDGSMVAAKEAGAQWGPQALGWLAAMEKLAGDPRANDAALARLQREMIVFPEFERSLAEAYASVGELGLAREVMRQAQRRDPKLYGPRMLLAVLRRNPNRQDYEALAGIWKTYVGKQSDYEVELAEAHAVVGEFDAARKAIEKISDPFHRYEATWRLARAQARAGDLTGAQATAAGIPDRERILDYEHACTSIAAVMAIQGDSAGARQMLSHVKSMAQAPTSAIMAYVLVKTGDVAGAKATAAQLRTARFMGTEAAALAHGMIVAAFIDQKDSGSALLALKEGRQFVEAIQQDRGSKAHAARLLIKAVIWGPHAAESEVTGSGSTDE